MTRPPTSAPGLPARLGLAVLALAVLALAVASGAAGCRSDAARDEVSVAGTAGEAAPATTSEAGTFTPGPADVGPGTVEVGEQGARLQAALDHDFSPDRTLGYTAARDALYAYEQRTHGRLCGVYEAFCVDLPTGDPSKEAGRLGINAEHTWPQSYGAREEPLKSDLHHLFPTRGTVNTSRGNLPLGEVSDRQADAWYRADQSQSTRPADDRGDWAERGGGRFEPPDAHKGNAARALFYVAATYPEVIDRGFFETMRTDLLAWNRLDPPDDAERARSAWIARLQGTENPFVLDPSLGDRAFGDRAIGTGSVGAGTVVGAAPPPGRPPPGPAAALWISEIHYDNDGEDMNEGFEVAGPVGTPLDGWRVVLYNGSTGQSYGTVDLSGAIPASGAVWVGRRGLQNGGPDGLALVDAGGQAVECLSYEGAFTAADGPASGCAMRDMAASEEGGVAAGRSLARAVPGGRWQIGPATPGRLTP